MRYRRFVVKGLALIALVAVIGLILGQEPAAAMSPEGTAGQVDTTAAASTLSGDSDLPAWIEGSVPEPLQTGRLLGVRYWKWVALFLLLFVGFLFDQSIRLLGRPTVSRVVKTFDSKANDDAIKKTVAALGLFGAALFWTVALRMLALSGNAREIAVAAVGVFTVLVGVRFAWRLTDLLGDILLHVAERTANKFDDILVPLLRKTAKAFLVAVGIVYGAQSLSINIVPLITGLGIGGLAFAFAAKDTIENFFGSIAVILDRPFAVGDWIVVEGTEGTVEEMGLRSTRVRTFYNSIVTVPNATLVRATVDNLGRRTYRRWKTYLGVQYDTPPEKLLAFTEGIRELVRQHPHTRKDFYQVWCNDFADFSLNILLYVFFHVPDWSTELRERERLFVDIVRLADNLGVQFAFPTQTLHLYKEEHAAPESQYTVPSGTHDTQSQTAGARAAAAIVAGQSWRGEAPGPVDFEEMKKGSEGRADG